ncbi:MAG TPA: VWA domain-containing protein, partial [Candidatus Nanoarchaeia archaeon]|nr:VWA domain-containing protein [Candidatus Nanoarchaeia archaeon]
SSYVTDGSGLIFVGGESSFDRGGYKGTLLETLMPVKIGASEEQNKSDINVVIVIDISSGTEDYVALEKALALSVVDSLSDKNNVGAVAFGYTPCQAFTIAEVKMLKEHKEELKEKISRLKFDGQSCFNIGIQGGYQLLSNLGGGKNIIFISDGKTTYQQLREDTFNVVRTVNAKGAKVFTVGVGTDTDSMSTDNNLFLDNIARLGEGIYFKADASNKLKVQFGDKADKEGEEFFNSLIPIDTTHFITFGMDGIRATISGYNYAVPKPAARTLVTTNKNIPIFVVWRFGLGRVVSVSTDDGLKWSGELLASQNSKLWTRSINWAIGDLSRKKSYDVSIKDTVLGKSANVNVISREIPKGEGINFAKIDTNLYSAAYAPDKIGFKDMLGATFAVNYNDEYANLGVNDEFTALVEKTGGKIFDPNDADGIIELVKAKSKRIKIESTEYRWPFAIIAMLIFLTEIAIRKVRENVKK